MCNFERSILKTRNMRIYSLVFACFTLMASSAWTQCDNLFFSEAAEGSSNNKYLEIYNPTSETVDLSGYAYPNVSNAPSVWGNTSTGTRSPMAPPWPQAMCTSWPMAVRTPPFWPWPTKP